jgi:hypothetical protein
MLREWDDIEAARKRSGSHVWRWVNLIRWADMHDLV